MTPTSGEYVRTWIELFPWMDQLQEDQRWGMGAFGPDGWWRAETPAQTADRLGDLLRPIAELATMLELAPWKHYAFQDLVPSVAPQTDVMTLGMGARARNALQRERVLSVHDLHRWTPARIEDLPNLGRSTVRDVVEALLSAAACGGGTIGLFGHEQLADDDSEKADRPAPQPSGSAGLIRLARYAAAFNPDATLDELIANPEALPASAQKALDELRAKPLADLGAVRATVTRPAAALEEWFDHLDERSKVIIVRRVAAWDPDTLTVLGDCLGVTRERVRQIEQKLVSQFRCLPTRISVLEDAVEILDGALPVVTTHDLLVGQHAWLAEPVFNETTDVLTVLLRMHDIGSREDGWVVRGSVDQIVDRTREVLTVDRGESLSMEVALDRLERLGINAEIAELWLQECGFRAYGQIVTRAAAGIGDKAFALLTESGDPLSTADLLERLNEGYAAGTVKNALAIDPRFTRADRDAWALATWDVRQYKTIRELIDDALIAAGGKVRLKELIGSLSEFSVAESSIRAYAAAYPFSLTDGWVRHATAPRAARASMEETRRCFWDGTAWKLRIDVTTDHLRGSGFGVPSALAALVGCAEGDKKPLRGPSGPVTVGWTGLQPTMSSIRTPLETLDAEVGDMAFLRFKVPDELSIELVAATTLSSADSRQRVALLATGRGLNGDEDLRQRLSTALRSDPTASCTHLVGLLRDRGDDDIAELLNDLEHGDKIGPSKDMPDEPGAFADLLGMDHW